jgi:NTE family protein
LEGKIVSEIDLSEKLKQLEAEVDDEIRVQNETRQKIWKEMTGHEDTAAIEAVNNSAGSAASTASRRITLEDINAPVITKDDFSSGERWALTLAGGGGKGAYEIGVWQALREIGLEKNLIAVSGSSSGALNAALISLNEFDKAKTIWSSIMPKQFLDINYDTIIGPLNTLVKRTLTAGLCSRDGLIDIIDKYLNLEQLAGARIPAYVSISRYSSDCIDCLSEKPQVEYISLSEVSPDDAGQFLLASSAMPYIYPPEIIHGNVYRDGGLADNVPIYPMTSVGADNLIVVKLEPDDKVDTSLYSKFKEVVEIIPSREIGDLFDGTLEFTSRNVMFRMLLGYYDTLRTFGLRMYRLNGIPLDYAEKKRREDADYDKIISTLRRNNTVNRMDDTINKLKGILN